MTYLLKIYKNFLHAILILVNQKDIELATLRARP